MNIYPEEHRLVIRLCTSCRLLLLGWKISENICTKPEGSRTESDLLAPLFFNYPHPLLSPVARNICSKFSSPRPIYSSAPPKYQLKILLILRCILHAAMLHACCSRIGLAYSACILQVMPYSGVITLNNISIVLRRIRYYSRLMHLMSSYYRNHRILP